MKTYACDVCLDVIKNPFEENMVEFTHSMEIDEHGIDYKRWKKKQKIHLCKRCFENFRLLSRFISDPQRSTGKIFSRSDVENMTSAEVKANYNDILQSMKAWDK